MSIIRRIHAIAAMGITSLSIVANADTSVSGIVSSSTTWEQSGSPYSIAGTVQVAQGATLTIAPGVTVNGLNHNIQVFGSLNAIGSAQSKITLNSVRVTTGTNSSPTINYAYVVSTGGSLCDCDPSDLPANLSLLDSQVTGGFNFGGAKSGVARFERNVFINAAIVANADAGKDTQFTNNYFYKSTVANTANTDTTSTTCDPNWIALGNGSGCAPANNLILSRNTFYPAGSPTLSLLSGPMSKTPLWQSSMDARNNFWSTTDPAVIGQMITDRNDDLNIANTIPFDPILTQADPATPLYSPPSTGGGNNGGSTTPSVQLTVIATGRGSVSSNPAGINCGSTCTFAFPLYSTVTLSEAPAPKGKFKNWGGACAGKKSSCTIQLRGDVIVKAKFK